MKIVRVRKADLLEPAFGCRVENTSILIDQDFQRAPDGDPEWLAKNAQFFQLDAEIIEFSLRHSLPGGTYDRLLSEMLKYKSSQFVVPFGAGNGKPGDRNE